MKPFTYSRAANVTEAADSLRAQQHSKLLGGGTNLVDLMKKGVEQPGHLIDITRLPLDRVEEHEGGLRIGALVRNSTVASHRLVVERYPLLSQAILAGASAQIRNMATTGGNLLQRTRCYYFYEPTFQECNKRVPGSGCAALAGYNRIHAILGASDRCIAVYPGDMAVALTALRAEVALSGQGDRKIPIDEFYRLPQDTPHLENNLKPGEVIVGVNLPPPWLASRAHYVKVRDRNSYAFALTSAAAVVALDADGRIANAGLALGGVAPKPWRVPQAEQVLIGKEPGRAIFQQAANLLTAGAKPYRYNAFKVEMARRAAIQALTVASGSKEG